MASQSLQCLLLLFLLPLIQKSVTSEKETPVAVSRRSSGDSIFFNSSHVSTCPSVNATYIVDNRICVNNREVIDGNLQMCY